VTHTGLATAKGGTKKKKKKQISEAGKMILRSHLESIRNQNASLGFYSATILCSVLLFICEVIAFVGDFLGFLLLVFIIVIIIIFYYFILFCFGRGANLLARARAGGPRGPVGEVAARRTVRREVDLHLDVAGLLCRGKIK
jgi:hypothetical protein